MVSFDEFAAWFATSLEEKKEGSIGFRLLQVTATSSILPLPIGS